VCTIITPTDTIVQQNEVREVTKKVRAALRGYGKYRELHRGLKSGGRISYRWIVAFAHQQNREPAFSRVVELGRALGLRITIGIEGP